MMTAGGAQRQTATRLGLAFALMAALLASVFSLGTARAAVNVNSIQGYQQDFNSLIDSGSAAWQNDTTLPGWYAAAGTTDITTYTAFAGTTGTAFASGLYSFGSGNDRALGLIADSTNTPKRMGVVLKNTTGVAMNTITVAYTGEQWIDANTTSAKLDFKYKTNATNIGVPLGASDIKTATGLTSINPLDFVAPQNAAAGPIDGNLPANSQRLTQAINLSPDVPPNGEILLVWEYDNITGNDPGLAVDDLSVTATLAGNAPAQASCPSTLTVAQGAETAQSISAIDPDGVISGATITSGGAAGITLNETPAVNLGDTYTAAIAASAAVAPGTYNLAIQFQNATTPAQTATCNVALTVTAAPTTGTANFGTSTKTVDKTQAAPGDEVTYTITVANSGDVAGTFLLTDTLDANLTLVNAPGLVAIGQTLRTSGTVNSGQTQQYTIVARVNASVADGTTISNNATLSSGQQVTPLPAPNVTVASSSSGIDFSTSTKTVDVTQAATGDEVTYTITLANSGDVAGTFLLTDTLDANLTLVSAPGLIATGQTLRASGTVVGGQSREYTIIARVNPDVAEGTVIRNSATLSSNGEVSTLTAPNVTVVTGEVNIYLPLISK